MPAWVDVVFLGLHDYWATSGFPGIVFTLSFLFGVQAHASDKPAVGALPGGSDPSELRSPLSPLPNKPHPLGGRGGLWVTWGSRSNWDLGWGKIARWDGGVGGAQVLMCFLLTETPIYHIVHHIDAAGRAEPRSGLALGRVTLLKNGL